MLHEAICTTKTIQPTKDISPLPLLLQRLDDIRAIRQKPIPISIIPDHLLRIPRARRAGAILDIHDIKALEICIDQITPDALVAVHAANKQRRDAGFLEVESEGCLGAPEAGKAV
jgi:hypothetical protein